jgi:hypothetical protein
MNIFVRSVSEDTVFIIVEDKVKILQIAMWQLHKCYHNIHVLGNRWYKAE